MYPHGYIGMTNPKLTDWSDNQSLDEFDEEEQNDDTDADGDEEAGD